jgi:Triose-phosphate Transporter family
MVNPRVLREVVRNYTYVLIWMTISISVILFNKWLLAYSGFPFPIALTLWHMAFCSVVGILCCRVFKLVRTHEMSTREYFNRVMPIGVLYAASLWLSNSAYLYLSVSFIQMTKSLMPGLVYATGIGLGTEKFSRAVAANMGLIAFGVVVCAVGEVNLVFKGLFQQLLALVFEATRLTMVQVLINSKGYAMNPLQSLYYVSPACFICLAVPFVALELGPMLRDTTLMVKPTVLLANAMAALALNLAVFLLIGKTSALTMNIAGVIKDWMLIFFSYYLFKAPVTALNLAGYAFCCTGVAIYNYMKLQLIRQKAALSTRKDAEKQGAGDSNDGLKSDANSNVNNLRSKEDVLEEIKRLQNQMTVLESRGAAGSKEN